MNEIDNISAQYPFDSYTYITTHLYVPYYRKLLDADIVIDNNMIGIVKRLEYFDDDGKDKPSLSPKDYYWIAAAPKDHLTNDSYIRWNTPPNIEK